MAVKKNNSKAATSKYIGNSFKNTRGKSYKQRAVGGLGGRVRGYGKVTSIGGVRVGTMGRHSYSGTSHEPTK